MSDFRNIKNQSEFCTELMLRLNKEIQSEYRESAGTGRMKDHSRKVEDSRRLRRELLKLIIQLER